MTDFEMPFGRTRVVHSKTVRLPAHGFASHDLQKICLTRRSLSRTQLTPVLQLRRDRAVAPRTAANSQDFRPGTDTTRRSPLAALSSVAVMIAIVALACWSTGLLRLIR